jgi:hypothetical protein
VPNSPGEGIVSENGTDNIEITEKRESGIDGPLLGLDRSQITDRVSVVNKIISWKTFCVVKS